VNHCWKTYLIVFTMVWPYSLPCLADTIPGLVRAATELEQAYDTFSTINKAVNDAENNVKPTADFSAAAKKYEAIDSDVKAIQFPPELIAPNVTSVGPVNSCAARNTVILALSSGIEQLQSSIDTVNSETAEINKALADIQQAIALNVEIQKALPRIVAIPIWGDSISADVFSMTQRVQKAVGDTATPLNKRLKQNNATSQDLTGHLAAWQNSLNAAEQFSNAPTPGGSYAQSCNSCSHDCEQLICNCRRINGSYLRTRINYPPCRSVENIDGNLRCGP
jgi:hypothetical protein